MDVELQATPTADEFLQQHRTSALLQKRRTSVGGNAAVDFTEAGLALVEKLVQLGMPIKHIACVFGMSESWMKTQLRECRDTQEAFQRGAAMEALDLLLAGKALERKNATVHMHARKRVLDEVEDPKKVVVEQRHVFSTVPIDQISHAEWVAKFAPPEAQTGDLTVTLTAEDVEDAEEGE